MNITADAAFPAGVANLPHVAQVERAERFSEDFSLLSTPKIQPQNSPLWNGKAILISQANPQQTALSTNAGEATAKKIAQSKVDLKTAFSYGIEKVSEEAFFQHPGSYLSLEYTNNSRWIVTYVYPHKTKAVVLEVGPNGIMSSTGELKAQTNFINSGWLPPSRAFEKALEYLKDEVNFSQPGGDIIFLRSSNNEWLLKLSNYPELYFRDGNIYIGDNGKVRRGGAQ